MPVIKCIENGLSLAAKDYERIAKLGDIKFDVKPKEDQIKCALYKVFSDSGYLVHVEASYARNKDRCDMLARKGRSTIAIEIKTAWAGVGWVNKPIEQASSWNLDIDKLLSLRESGSATHGFLIICLSYQKGSKWEEVLKSEVNKLDAQSYPSFKIQEWNGLTEIQFYLIEVFKE